MCFQFFSKVMTSISAVVLMAPLAHAVHTKDCPNTISVEVSSMDLLSENEIYRRADFWNSDKKQRREDFDSHLGAIRTDLRQLGTLKKNTVLSITDRKNGVCEYKSGRFDAKIYSKSGKNLMRLDPVPGVVIFIEVRSLSSEGIKLSRADNRAVKAEYGDIGESGLGDRVRAVLAFADLEIE